MGFLDNYKNGPFNGFAIQHPDSFLKEKPENALVVIANMYVNEARTQLANGGFENMINAHPLILEWIDRDLMKRNLLMIGGVALVIAALVGFLLAS